MFRAIFEDKSFKEELDLYYPGAENLSLLKDSDLSNWGTKSNILVLWFKFVLYIDDGLILLISKFSCLSPKGDFIGGLQNSYSWYNKVILHPASYPSFYKCTESEAQYI